MGRTRREAVSDDLVNLKQVISRNHRLKIAIRHSRLGLRLFHVGFWDFGTCYLVKVSSCHEHLHAAMLNHRNPMFRAPDESGTFLYNKDLPDVLGHRRLLQKNERHVKAYNIMGHPYPRDLRHSPTVGPH